MSKAAAFSGEKMGTAMQQTPALAYWMAAFLVMPITAILRYTGCFHKRKGTARRAAAYKWEKGGAGVAAHPAQRAAAQHLHPGGVERGTVPSGREADLLPVLPDVIRLFTPAGFRSTIAL